MITDRNIMRRLLLPLFLVLLFLIPPPVFADDPGPTDQLKPIIDKLIGILSDENLKGDEHRDERRAKIMAEISSGFDFREMSRRVLGRTWNTISEEQKDYFTVQMTKLLENVYIGKLETYSQEDVAKVVEQAKIEFVAERIKGQRAQVTTLIEYEGAKLPVHYIMQKEHTTWMVYDINIEGVSLVRNYMEQFKSIIRQDSYEGLIKIIEDKNKTFAEDDSSA